MAHPNLKRGLAGLGVVGLSVGLLAGCTAGDEDSGGDVTITVALAANPQMQTAESLISDFEEKNPGINV